MMAKHYRVILTALLILAPLVIPQVGSDQIAIAAPAAQINATQLEQNQYFFGPCITTLADQGLRVDNKGAFKFTVIATPPKWDVTVYRADEKLYITETLKEFESTALVNNYLVSEKILDFSKRRPLISNMNVLGFPAKRISTNNFTLKILPLGTYANKSQIETINHGIYRMPTEGGIPLDYRGQTQDKDFFTGSNSRKVSIQIYMTTEKITAVKVGAEFFTLPKGYKKAASIREVVSGENVRKESEEFLLDSSDRDSKKKDSAKPSNPTGRKTNK